MRESVVQIPVFLYRTLCLYFAILRLVFIVKNQLLNIYKQIFTDKNNSPDWAVHKLGDRNIELIHCPIPFIGKDYLHQESKILLYASAENLSKYHLNNSPYLDNDEFAINRHRIFFDDSVAKSNVFYPNVHIQPITDGGLALVAYYIFCKLNGYQELLPAEFLEKICFANYCKYTISGIFSSTGKQNLDYASNPKFLEHSHKYVEADISILSPDYIVIPKTIYETDRSFIDSIKGNAQVIPIYQINSKNINMRIKAFHPINGCNLYPMIRTWWIHLSDGVLNGKTQQNFLSVFNYVDDVLSKILNLQNGKLDCRENR